MRRNRDSTAVCEPGKSELFGDQNRFVPSALWEVMWPRNHGDGNIFQNNHLVVTY